MGFAPAARTRPRRIPRRRSGEIALRKHDVPDGRLRRRFRGAIFFQGLLFFVVLGPAVTQRNLVLSGVDPQDLEVVLVAGLESRRRSRGARLRLVAVAFGPTLFDLADVAEALDAAGELDERAKVGHAQELALDDVIDVMHAEPICPDVVDLLDAEGEPPIFGVNLEHLGFDRLTLLERLAGVLDALGPTDVADVDQPVDAFLHFDEGAEIREAADAPRHGRANGVFVAERHPGIGHGLLQAEGDAALLLVHAE